MSKRSVFPRKDVLRMARSLEAQGCVIEEKAEGVWVRFPGGAREDQMFVHFTLSDTRAYKNVRSRVLRRGLRWEVNGGK